MRESGLQIQGMELEYKSGLMGQNTMENGGTIKLTERENFGMLTVIISKGIGRTIKPMVMEFIFILMVQNMRVIGKMIFKMALE